MPGDPLSSGSIVRRGEGNARVVLTGARTFFGRTTELVQQARPKLHIEAVVAKVVRWLFVIVGTLLGVVLAVSLLRGAPLVEMIPLLLVLLMSAVPVALPVMFTVSMAVGSSELARRGVLVTRLSATEDAATMDVLCVDKTGTITMNQLAVADVIPLDGASAADVLLAGALASQEADQDPIDLAFLAAARQRAGLRGPGRLYARVVRAVRRPEPAHRGGRDAGRAAAARDEGRGANHRRGLRTRSPGHRGAGGATSASRRARATAPWRWPAAPRRPYATLLGLVTLVDPLRPDAAQPDRRTAGDLGVRVKMLTGDALPVATGDRAQRRPAQYPARGRIEGRQRHAGRRVGGDCWQTSMALPRSTRKTSTRWCSNCRPPATSPA